MFFIVNKRKKAPAATEAAGALIPTGSRIYLIFTRLPLPFTFAPSGTITALPLLVSADTPIGWSAVVVLWVRVVVEPGFTVWSGFTVVGVVVVVRSVVVVWVVWALAE